MSAYNCKCAWHGEYCDTAGMDQNTASAYVTQAFNIWAVDHKQKIKAGCEGQGGFWNGSGCLICDAGTFFQGGVCKNIIDLCSDDPLVSFNGAQCFCPTGYKLSPDKTCISLCGDEPNTYYDDEVNDCVCKLGYEFDGNICSPICGNDPTIKYDEEINQCFCPSGYFLEGNNSKDFECISECGDDLLIEFNEETKACFCPDGYLLEEDTDENFICEETNEVEIELNYEDQSPPLIADGKTSTNIHITVKDINTGIGVESKFTIGYTTASKKGEITKVIENSVGDYLITYKTANLSSNKQTQFEDYIYVFYESQREGKEIYKNRKIELSTGMPIVISKNGFQEQNTTIAFKSNKAIVKVYTITKDGEKIPVNGAEIGIKNTFDFEITSSNGEATLSAPRDIDGSNINEIEVILKLNKEVSEIQEKAKKQYEQMIKGEKGITNATIKDFIINFNKYLANVQNNKTEEITIGLKRTGYILLYMSEGKKLAFDISKQAAASIKNQISDTLDLFEVADMSKEKLGEKLSSNTIDGLTNEAQEKLKKLTPQMMEKMDEITNNFKSGIINVLKIAIKKHAPGFKDEWANEIIGEFFPNPLDGYSTDGLVEKAVNSTKTWGENAIENKITEYLTNEYDQMLFKGMKQLAQMIKSQTFNTINFDENISRAKSTSTDLRTKYLKAHEVSFNVSAIKDATDLFNNTVIEAFKITGFWRAQAEAFEKGYKMVRSGVINNVEIYYWFTTYGDFMLEVNQNINEGLGVSSFTQIQNTKTHISLKIFPLALATTEISVKDFETLFKYQISGKDINFYTSIKEINTLLLEIFPDDDDLLEIENNINKNIQDSNDIMNSSKKTAKIILKKLESEKQKLIKQQEKSIKNIQTTDKKLDVDGDGEITIKDVTTAEWITLGVILALGILFLRILFKLIKRIIKGKPRSPSSQKNKKLNPFKSGTQNQKKTFNPFEEK